jgi:hypothetical protein
MLDRAFDSSRFGRSARRRRNENKMSAQSTIGHVAGPEMVPDENTIRKTTLTNTIKL